MLKTVSSREAQARFGSMLEWARENDEGVLVQRRGEPSAAIISYAGYRDLARLRRLERKLKALQALHAIRDDVQSRVGDLDDEAAYALAGFGPKAIAQLLEAEEQYLDSEQ